MQHYELYQLERAELLEKSRKRQQGKELLEQKKSDTNQQGRQKRKRR